MRLTEVRIEGLRALGNVTVPLTPVTVIAGPNGGGKSSVVGAVAYALTGRYPGVVGVHADDLRPLGRVPEEGFLVRVHALDGRRDGPEREVIVERGLHGDRHFLRTSGSGEAASRKASDAEASISKNFGDAEWYADAFDPERSIWRKSVEQRTQWAFALCAGRSGWTHARLRQELGEPTEDWDPLASEETATCLELNLLRLDERLLSAQRVVREATKIAEGIAVGPDAPTEEELGAAETKLEAVQAEGRRLAYALAQAVDQNDKRERLTRIIARTEEELAGLRPPEAPAPLASELRTVDAELDTWRERFEPAKARADQAEAKAELLRLALTLSPVTGSHECPTCAQPVSDEVLQLLEVRTGVAKTKARELTQALDDLIQEETALLGRRQAASERSYQHKVTTATHEQLLDAFALHRVTLQHQRDERKAELATLGVQIPGCNAADVEKAQKAIQAALHETHALRQAYALGAERTGQREAARLAASRAEVLKARQGRMREVRKRMLYDGVEPLARALGDLGSLAPGTAHWALKPRKGGVAFGLVRREVLGENASHERFVPVEMMSSSEKYRATIALLVATAIVRRPPWVGLFLDSFEQVDPLSRRSLLGALQGLAARGLLDNVVVAVADGPPEDLAEGIDRYVATDGALRHMPRPRSVL